MISPVMGSIISAVSVIALPFGQATPFPPFFIQSPREILKLWSVDSWRYCPYAVGMLERLLSNLPSWFFLVLMSVCGIGSWFLMSRVLHGGDTFNVVLHWMTLFLAVLAFAVFCVSTRIWHDRQRHEAE